MRVATVEEVLAAAKAKQAQKATAGMSILPGIPSLPTIPNSGLVAAVVEWTFVGADFNPPPEIVWALIVDQQMVTEIDRKNREANMDPARAGLPRLAVYSAETPYAIVRTLD